MSQLNDLELAVRTIENILPDMPNKSLEKWHGIFTTALIKLEAEQASTQMHLCSVCGFEEYGYRTDLPIAWREKGDIKICFNHEDAEVADMLKKGLEAEAPAPVNEEETLEDLMALL